MFGSLEPIGTALTAVGTFAGTISDILSGVAFFTGEGFATALATGFMA